MAVGSLLQKIYRLSSLSRVLRTKWVAWWAACQPEWRSTSSWPFAQEDAAGLDWGDLPNSGKDGLFVVLVSLGWWVCARDPSKDSKVEEAIVDVAWVISNLVSFLSSDIVNGSVSVPDSPVNSSPPSKHPGQLKIGPPLKRTKRGRS